MRRTIRIVVATVAACAAAPAARSGDASPTEALIREAREAARRNDVAAARAAYDRVFAAPDLTLPQRVAAHLDMARVLLAKQQFADAIAEHGKALALPGLPAPDRFALLTRSAEAHVASNFHGAFASYADDGIAAAAAIYESIAADPEASGAGRVGALKGLADCCLERMDVPGATSALERAVALPGLSGGEKSDAVFNLARARERQLDHAGARALYEQLLEADPKGRRAELERRIAAARAAQTYEATVPAGYEEADESLEALRQSLADDAADEKARWTAFTGILPKLVARGAFDEARRFYETHAAAFRARDAKRRDPLRGLLDRPGAAAGRAGYDAFAAWVARTALALPELPAQEAARHRTRLYEALLGARDIAGAARVAGEMAAAAGATPRERLQWELASAALRVPEDAARAARAAELCLAAPAPGEVAAAERAEALLGAARAAMRVRHYATARALDARREKMLVPAPRRALACAFLSDAPRDCSAFLASPLWNDAARRGTLDRKYGDNLQFLLETDSSTVGRAVGGGDGAAGLTQFVATCDADGVSVFLLAKCRNPAEVADGFSAAGGYEMYLAPGARRPYYCFLVDGGKLSDGFVTMYDGRHFRQAKLADGTLRCETRVTPAGVGTLVFLSWELFWDRLPEDGDTWQFDVLHWEGGGYSWGGTRTVHGRSDAGDLVFADMSLANLTAIRRRLAVAALRRYQRAKRAGENGVLDYWQDPALGDRRFYAAPLGPLVAELDALAARVRPGMTDDDVDAVFARAVGPWMALRFVVGDLRQRYLEDRRIGGD